MRVLHASSEAVPFAKTGGLADVVGALPKASATLGIECLTVLPWYAQLAGDVIPYWIGDVEVPFDGSSVPVGVGTLEHEGQRFAFVGHPFFQRDAFYGYADDSKRFALFARAVPEVAQRVGFQPDLVHVHDWHAALTAAVLKHAAILPAGFSDMPSIVTVHNAQHQGWADAPDVVAWARLPGAWVDPLAHMGRGNLLHAGLVSATLITTVSPSYARELRTSAFGCGLEEVFEARASDLHGVLNGIDMNVWNPQIDRSLAATFDHTSVSARQQNASALRKRWPLETNHPTLGVVSRLAEQKGIDVVLDATPALLAQGFNVVIIGSGDPLLEAQLRQWAAAHPTRVAVHAGYDDALARLVFGGCDAVLIPSRFEPCGLTQMMAMRYGALPIARATGGLKDTIVDGADGFLFADLTVDGLTSATARALAVYRAGQPWRAMQQRAMQRDWGWTQAAERYRALYLRAIGAA